MRKLVALFLLFVFPDMIPARNCSTVLCSHNSSIPIRFPFTLESNRRHDCGYPGFSIKCSRMGKTALELPRSGEFFLRDISYAKQQIWLYDPGNCLPGWLMKLNLSGSPFSAPHHLDFTFLSCPKNQTSESGIIDCLSNNTDVVLATYNKLWADLMVSLYCKIIGIVPVPTSRKIRPSRGFLVDLNKDIQLSWHDPDCKTCERKHGFCGFKSNTSQKIGCSNMKSDNRLHRIAKIVSLSISLPSFICGIGIWYLRNKRHRPSTTGHTRASTAFSAHPPAFRGFSTPSPPPDRGANSSSSQRTVTSNSQPPAVPGCLSERMTASFPKMEVGDSWRITDPSDNVCPICLSDYLPKDILRTVPLCNHSFHAKCIDEWFQIKSLCPVCRNPVFFS